ncbi:uncharacterized protein JCM15063_003761 [Sporobolomyces koalae]|uniref:uncharacterized protein n=1 Tax=Sporobolomyces koalae TaxID=500713 RepID=UPI00317412BB
MTSRPTTPSATTPRRPFSSSSRPVSRASSRPVSPVKASSGSSLNQPISTSSPRFSRPSSSLASHGTVRGSTRTSTDLTGTRTSPTKRTSPVKPNSTTIQSTPHTGTADPFTSTSSIASSSCSSRRTTVAGGGGTGNMFHMRSSSLSARSSDASGSNDAGDTTDDEVPRRRAGFGPVPTPLGTIYPETETETETEGEGGFLTAEEGALSSGLASSRWRESVLDRADSETETETEEAFEEEKDGKKQNVVVCLRVRPSKSLSEPNPIYKLVPTQALLSLGPSHPTLLKRGGKTSDEYDFRFDLLHVAPDPTERLYDRKIRPVVKAALVGFNGTVFAYGQTASGKTHTMMGSANEPGIIPLAIDELFSYIHKQNTDRTYSLRVSFLEIYNEHLRDLLANPQHPSSGPVRQPEIVDGGTVKNLEERPVSMPQQVLEVLREGEQRRRVGQTDWNERSSRSHCVFIVTIESMSKYQDGSARTSKLNLIDLAGSESATGQEERRKEGSFINKSLLTLGTVIGKLTEPHSSTAHIPYRDSKLTRLLQPALSGNSRVAVVCTISPDVEQATETLSTLKFAKRAKMVVTKAERGVLVTDQMMLKQYAAQIEKLQSQIEHVEGGQIMRERDLAAQRADEAERRGKEAQDALAEKEIELAKLRSQLAHTQSLVLTGPTLEANARRVSGSSFAGSMLSPSRSRSLNYGAAGGGHRSVSEMSSLGLGTPSKAQPSLRSGLSESVTRSSEDGEEEPTSEQEAELARLLAEKNTSLATAETELAVLRTQVQQLNQSSTLARLDAEKSAQSNEDRKNRIVELENQLAIVRENLRLAELERDRLATELQELRTEMNALKLANQDALAVIANLESAQSSFVATREDLVAKDGQIVQLEATLNEVRRELAKREAAAQLPDPKDDTIASFERQVESIRQELATVVAAKRDAVQSAADEIADIRKERDIAVRSIEEAEKRIQEAHDLAELQAKRHELAETQSAQEKEAARAALQADIDRLHEDLAAKIARIEQLERTVEALENLEARRKRYEADQRSGLDKLKSRMEDMRAKSATPTPTPRSAVLSSSTGSESDSSQQQVKELQTRNGELLARMVEMQKAADASLAREKRQMTDEIEAQRVQLVQTESKAEDWRQKYLAAQRLLDKMTSKSQPSIPPSITENLAPTPLGELKLASPFSRMTLSTSTTSIRPSLNFAPAPPLARAASKTSTMSPPAFPSPPLEGNVASLWSSTNKPPPLPSSPHQRNSAAKERNIRRKTIAKDLVNLQASKVVDQRREGWDSPTSSPTKADLDKGSSTRLSSRSDSVRRHPTDLFGARERKSSWE